MVVVIVLGGDNNDGGGEGRWMAVLCGMRQHWAAGGNGNLEAKTSSRGSTQCAALCGTGKQEATAAARPKPAAGAARNVQQGTGAASVADAVPTRTAVVKSATIGQGQVQCLTAGFACAGDWHCQCCPKTG